MWCWQMWLVFFTWQENYSYFPSNHLEWRALLTACGASVHFEPLWLSWTWALCRLPLAWIDLSLHSGLIIAAHCTNPTVPLRCIIHHSQPELYSFLPYLSSVLFVHYKLTPKSPLKVKHKCKALVFNWITLNLCRDVNSNQFLEGKAAATLSSHTRFQLMRIRSKNS